MTQEFIDSIKRLKYKVTENSTELIAYKNDNGYCISESGNKFKITHLYSDYIYPDLDEAGILDVLNNQFGSYRYGCSFGVMGFIHPGRHRDAKEYLLADDMTEYYDGAQSEYIRSIKWVLEGDQSGVIYIETCARLNRQGLSELKSWIDGQNSDGLGEGFEQQEFISLSSKGYVGSTIAAGNIYKLDGFESTSK